MRPAAVIVMIALAPLSVAFADVYRSIDAQGHVLYSDTPTPGAQLVRTTGAHHSLMSGFTDTPVASAKPAAPAAKGDDQHDAKAEQAAARSVQNDVAQTRAEQCKKAQDAYEKSVQARRIYNVGADGERTYLSDEEADKARVNNKLQVDELCTNVQP
jgi:Domain of unknown function (DUF4124)